MKILDFSCFLYSRNSGIFSGSLLSTIIRISAKSLVRFVQIFSFALEPRQREYTSAEYVISITSFPRRMMGLRLVLFSVLQQNFKCKVYLWLAREEFPQLESIPMWLYRWQKKGFLEVRFVDGNIKSHKKYLYAMKEFSDKYIITLDDDIVLPSAYIEDLVIASQKRPNDVICGFSNRIAVSNGKLKKYSEWTSLTENIVASKDCLPIGAGGCVYPPNSLNISVFNLAAIVKYASSADDLWLWIHARLNNTEISVRKISHGLIGVYNIGNINLHTLNVEQGNNDLQMESLHQYLKTFHNMTLYDLIK